MEALNFKFQKMLPQPFLVGGNAIHCRNSFTYKFLNGNNFLLANDPSGTIL